MKRGVFVLETAYAAFTHLLIRADIIFRELSVLAENDVETQPENTDSYNCECYEEYFHLKYEIRADSLVIVNLVDDACKHLGHRYDPDLRIIRQFRMRNGVGDIHFLEG